MPHGHGRTTTVSAGLRQTGIVAPRVLDGPLTGPAFHAYVEQASRHRSRRVTAWCSTLAAHKAHGVPQAIAAAGALILHLPPTARI